MKLDIVAKNYHVSEHLNKILQDKLKKLDKYFSEDDVPCKVVLSEDGRQCKMEVSISYHGANIRCEVTGETMYYNIDECLPKLERQIVKHRGKLSSIRKMPEVNEYEFVSDVEEPTPAKIEKVKTFDVEPMTPEDAAEELDMTGHDFYIFNSISGEMEVVYRRKDGTIGLLCPKSGK